MELLLDKDYEIDEGYVNKMIEEYDVSFVDVCARFGGINFKSGPESCRMIMWQVNVARMKNTILKLPTIISLVLDRSGIIRHIHLHDTFRGSQGITCSWKYLNRNLEKELTGERFELTNPKIKDELFLHCRHIFELVNGGCSFYEMNMQLGRNRGLVAEATVAGEADGGLLVDDILELNGKRYESCFQIGNFRNKVRYGAGGTITKCDGISITDRREEINIQRIEADNYPNFVRNVLKAVFPYWKKSLRELGAGHRFSCSHLFPPTFYGVLVQAISLVLFNGNYSYFQHTINGLQRVNESPCCIGVINSIGEGIKYFEGFRKDDLAIDS